MKLLNTSTGVAIDRCIERLDVEVRDAINVVTMTFGW